MGKLIKTQLKNGKYLYETITEEGERIKLRTSNREYIACTVNGEFFFGRMDLVGKGDHGKLIRIAQEKISNPNNFYEMTVRACKSNNMEIPDKDAFIAERQAQGREQLRELKTIITL